jgi:dephospho-CoA kinase
MSKSKQLYKIGLTGGIASGKSKLLAYLSTIPRIYTVNLDLYGHAVYQYNPLVVRNIGRIFGEECLTRGDFGFEVNREKLG